jgi:hypothetical protein
MQVNREMVGANWTRPVADTDQGTLPHRFAAGMSLTAGTRSRRTCS